MPNTTILKCLNKCTTMNTDELKAYKITIGMSNCSMSDKGLIWDEIDRLLSKGSALVEMGENDGEVD